MDVSTIHFHTYRVLARAYQRLLKPLSFVQELTKLKRVIEEKDELISGLRVHLREICLDRYPVVVERDELRHQLEDMIKVQEKLLAEKEFYKVPNL